jgi:hypothetical protein
VKCLRGDKLFLSRFYQSDFTRAENLSVLSDFTRAENLSVLSDFTKTKNSLDFTRAENWVEGVSVFEVWDIGQVTVSNFD